MSTTADSAWAQGRPLRLEVFYAFGMYDTARMAAMEVARNHPTLWFEAWDVLDPANTALLREKGVSSFPTVRLYRGDLLLAESTQARWDAAGLGHWLGAHLKSRGTADPQTSRLP